MVVVRSRLRLLLLFVMAGLSFTLLGYSQSLLHHSHINIKIRQHSVQVPQALNLLFRLVEELLKSIVLLGRGFGLFAKLVFLLCKSFGVGVNVLCTSF